MKYTKIILAVGLSCALLATVIIYGVVRHVRTIRPPLRARQEALLIDTSDSRSCDCDQVSTAARTALTGPVMGNGSKLWLFVTGDQSTAEEPILIGAYPAPYTRRVMEGREFTERQLRDKLDQIKAACSKFRQTKRSPIYLAIKRVVEQLRAEGCNKGVECGLQIQSDLSELSEPGVRDSLKRGKIKSRSPHPIDNENINISVCGLAEVDGSVTGKHDAHNVNVTEEIWRKLFSDSARVTFSPHCQRQ